jgi:hypothetical protein
MMYEFSHLVVVTSQHGEKFLGYISNDGTSPKRYVEECVKNNEPIALHEVRLFACQVQPEMSRETGQLMGVKTFATLLPVDVCTGPMECLSVRPSSWYFVRDVPSLQKKIEQLLDGAKKNELANQARESGLILPGCKS